MMRMWYVVCIMSEIAIVCVCFTIVYRPYALMSLRRHVGGQSHCLVRACATGTSSDNCFYA